MSDNDRPDEMNDEEDETEIEILPVTRWDLGSVSEEYVVFRPHVLTAPDQDEDEAEATNYYALTPLQVRELAEQLVELLQEFDDEDDEDEDEDDGDEDPDEAQPGTTRQ